MKLNEILKESVQPQAAWILDDEGFPHVEAPPSRHTMDVLQYAERITWNEAQRRVISILDSTGEKDAFMSFTAFRHKYGRPRGSVMMFQDEFLAIFV